MTGKWIDGIKYVNGMAVEADENIRTAAVKEGTAGIGSCCFIHCEKLASVVVPAGVKKNRNGGL